ncbi:MAG: tRNA epoxyqueuosine(34) reductase QueG [Nitrospinae bacterium]|nr:tRNA epoxyqueuosine(34) reductase QueG [Nitrospinota bacterium]
MLDLEKTEKIKIIEEKAYSLGFDGFGITRPQIEKAGENFSQWLGLGYAGDMAYMARGEEKRRDPNLVLKNVKSIICLRTNYFTAEKGMDFLDFPDRGDVSLYALNQDYHDIITPRLKELEKTIRNELADCQTKIYVDTGPILEKPLAEQAGLGWVGKHTNLLSQDIGSWYFLSEILIDVELPESEMAENHCGTCRSCIDICPTDAIVSPYVLDSKKCISYLTIELKGVIPTEFRKAIGNRIYGCDDCQIVCPWNSYAVKTEEPAFKSVNSNYLLIDLIQMDDEEFRKRFKGSPIKRIKRRGLLRNVAVALGNSKNLQAVPFLIKALDDREPLIRAHIVWALGELMQSKCIPLLNESLAEEKDSMVIQEIEAVRGRFLEDS